MPSRTSAVAAAKLWNLDEEQIEHALGLAGVCNIATRQTRTGQIADWKACAFSNAARNGVFAADLGDLIADAARTEFAAYVAAAQRNKCRAAAGADAELQFRAADFDAEKHRPDYAGNVRATRAGPAGANTARDWAAGEQASCSGSPDARRAWLRRAFAAA